MCPSTAEPGSYGYDAADHQTSVAYPAVGGLGAETTTTSYNSVGLPETMTGTDPYVRTAAYDDRARPFIFGFGEVPGGGFAFAKTWGFNPNQELSLMTGAALGTEVQNLGINYDKAGNVTERTTTLAGSSSRECFDYDQRQRLASAYTTTTGTTCASGTNKGQGAQPYNHTYTYSHDGNLTTRLESGTTINYTYPAGGPTSTRPHAPTAVGANSYTWDANGNQATRTIGGQTETLTWDAEHRLASIDDPDGDSSFVYDPDGQRLLRHTPQGDTLYLEGHEITATNNGATVTAVRTYSFGGSMIATRNTSGVDYLAADNQNSIQVSVPSGTTTATVRTYQPYGKPRHTGQHDTNRGWIGETEDTTTGLNYLNARYYDPVSGVFIAPDLLFDQASPRSINPLSYGHNNPTSLSDPGGLSVDEGGQRSRRYNQNFNQGQGGWDRPPASTPCWGWECQHPENPDPMELPPFEYVPILDFENDVCVQYCRSIDIQVSQYLNDHCTVNEWFDPETAICDPGEVENLIVQQIEDQYDELGLPELVHNTVTWGLPLTSQQMDEHIIPRHGPESTATNAGKFAAGTDETAIRNMVEETILNSLGGRASVSSNTNGRPGIILEYTFDKIIGTNISGKVSSTIRVVVIDGWVRTAFPI